MGTQGALGRPGEWSGGGSGSSSVEVGTREQGEWMPPDENNNSEGGSGSSGDEAV